MEEYILRLHKAIETFIKNIDQDFKSNSDSNITKGQLFLLYTIQQSGKCKLSDLANKLNVKPSAVTVMIDRLEKQNYVKRSQDANDRRAIYVALTADGEKLLQIEKINRNQVFENYLKKLSEKELITLIKTIEKLNSAETERTE